MKCKKEENHKKRQQQKQTTHANEDSIKVEEKKLAQRHIKKQELKQELKSIERKRTYKLRKQLWLLDDFFRVCSIIYCHQKSKTHRINGFIGERLRFVCSLIFVAFKTNCVFKSVLKWSHPIISLQSLNWKCICSHWFNWKWLQITSPKAFSTSSQTYSVWLQVRLIKNRHVDAMNSDVLFNFSCAMYGSKGATNPWFIRI